MNTWLLPYAPSSDFDFPIMGVLGGRAITMGPAMVSLEGANSGDPNGDPLGIHWGSESKTGDPGVLYPKKPKDSGGSCARSVPLYFALWLKKVVAVSFLGSKKCPRANGSRLPNCLSQSVR